MVPAHKPIQAILQMVPAHICSSRKQSLISSWYASRDWPKCSLKAGAAFCFCCLHLSVSVNPAPDAHVIMGSHNWKNVMETERGNQNMKLQRSICHIMWKERKTRDSTGKEMSNLFNADQLQKNSY